jgi:hypothetical protein
MDLVDTLDEEEFDQEAREKGSPKRRRTEFADAVTVNGEEISIAGSP